MTRPTGYDGLAISVRDLNMDYPDNCGPNHLDLPTRGPGGAARDDSPCLEGASKIGTVHDSVNAAVQPARGIVRVIISPVPVASH